MADDSRGKAADSYFAAASKDKIGLRLFEVLRKSQDANAELQTLWSAAYGHYFPALEDSYGTTARLTRDGKKGELALVRTAKNRRLAGAVCGIVLGANPSFEPRGINHGGSTRASVSIARSILDSWWQLRGMKRMSQKWVEQAFFATESFMFAPWDDSAGEAAGVDENGMVIRGGDIKLRTVLPWDTARDATLKDFDDSTWFGLRVWRNKWDILARYPTDILGVPSLDNVLGFERSELALHCSGVVRDFIADSDRVPVWHWYHLPTDALPSGREVMLVTPDCVLRDVPLDGYEGFPFVRLTPAELFDTPFGYSAFLDGMSLQELSDGVDSALATNLLACGVQSLVVGRGTKKRDENLLNMSTLEVGPDELMPQGINFTKNPPDADKLRAGWDKTHQQNFGLNDVYLGQPDTAQMNAQAFALLSSLAVQANNPFQAQFLEAVGQLGTHIIRTYAKRIDAERLIPLIGKGDRHLLSSASFKGEDLKGIEQVYCRAGSALEQTIPGRVQIIELMQTHGVPLQADQILDVVRTGNIEPLTHALRDELDLIQIENEQISQGVNPPVHAFDNHLRHGAEHAAPILNQYGRADKKAVVANQQHVDDHYIAFFSLPSPMAPNPATGAMEPLVDPATGQPQKPNPQSDPQYPVRIRMLLGQQPPPMAPMPPGAPGAAGGPPPPGGPPPGAEAGPGTPLAPPGSQGQMNGVELPKAPTNPLTGNGVAGGPPGVQ